MRIKLFYSPRIYKESNLDVKRDFGYSRSHPMFPPLGIAIVTSFLKKMGYYVEQDDLNIKVYWDNIYSGNNEKKVNMSLFEDKKRIMNFVKNGKDTLLEEEGKKILKKTKWKGFDLYGFSIVDDINFSAIASTIVLSKILKEMTDAYTVIGGVFKSRPIPEISLIDLKYVDFIILENHFTFADLLKGIETGDLAERKIDKLIYKKNLFPVKKVALKKGISYFWESKSIDEIRPKPNFNGLPLSLYKYKIQDNDIGPAFEILLLPYSFGFGCPLGCVYCPNSAKPFWKYKNPEKVARELKEISKEYKTNSFIFMNDNFNPNYEYTEKLIKELKNQDVNVFWTDCANLTFLNKKLLKDLREVGAVRLIFGIESGSNKILNFVGKRVTMENAEKMIKYSFKLGMVNEVDLIAGLPHETDKDVNDTVNFVKRIMPYVGWFQLTKFMLLESKLKQHPEEYGITNMKDNITSLEDERIFPRRFDEINGLKWKEKIKQINYSYNKVFSVITNSKIKWINLHVLFYLNSQLNKSSEIPKVWSNWKNEF
jgi:radical SAM superfamily enzyme YgiQ (UPF0313 family)